jgi:hypothetical protein
MLQTITYLINPMIVRLDAKAFAAVINAPRGGPKIIKTEQMPIREYD